MAGMDLRAVRRFYGHFLVAQSIRYYRFAGMRPRENSLAAGPPGGRSLP